MLRRCRNGSGNGVNPCRDVMRVLKCSFSRIGSDEFRFPDFMVEGPPDFPYLKITKKIEYRNANSKPTQSGKESLKKNAKRGVKVEHRIEYIEK